MKDSEGEEDMYYEIYADSLFLLNFTLNLYLLLLVNRSLYRTATGWRIFLGAIWGGVGYCLMFLLPVPMIIKVLFAAVCVSGGSLVFVFRPIDARAFFRLTEKLLLYAVMLGGTFYLLMNHVKVFRNHMMSIVGILACGGIIMLLIYSRIGQAEKESRQPCVVELHNGREQLRVQGIVDTGNSLTEPFSGKPVSVMDREVFEKLWKEEELLCGFRAIPYRSVGCERGIMKGYEVPEIVIEQGGVKKVCRNIYVGISEGKVSSAGNYQILVHPKLLQG